MKSNQKVLFIINPAAGDELLMDYTEWIRSEARKRWYNYEVRTITEKLSAEIIARKYRSRFDMIVACGGDGTINHTINGLASTDTKSVLGILPVGSGNDFAKTLQLPESLIECMNLLYRQQIKTIDLIRYRGDADGWCANTLGIGLDGWTNYFAQNFRDLPGPLKYVAGAINGYLRFKGAKLSFKVNSTTISDEFLMITACNGRWEGGMFYLAPQADLSDGLMNVLTVKSLPLIKILSYLPKLKNGLHSRMDGIQYYECKSLEIFSNEGIAVHADGEHLDTKIRNLHISVSEKSLFVVAPTD